MISMLKKLLILLFAVLIFSVALLGIVDNNTSQRNSAVSKTSARKSAPDRILVKFKDKKEKKNLEKKHGMKEHKHFKFIDTYVYKVNSHNKGAILKSLEKRQDIKFAEPDFEMEVQVTPNDPYFSNLWGLYNTWSGDPGNTDINAPAAWDTGTGSNSIVVAVIDTGVDYNHEDLAANMWQNPGEIPGDFIDNDGNGYTDDIYGIDAINNDTDPWDDHYHGTHCAGTIGAAGNNGIGVAGVCWNVKIMALKFLGSGGSGWTSDAVECVYYAIDNGAHIMSNSWGGGGYSQALADAITAAQNADILFIAAAGNDALDNDILTHYPSSYVNDNVISVASTDYQENLSSFSNYGVVSVDVAAPGSSVYSTMPGDSYAYLSGTSMATPHVAGLAALLKSRNPALTWDQLKALILYTADPLASLDGKIATGARIDAYSAIMDAFNPPPARYTLEVEPYTYDYLNPITGAAITISPADVNGDGDGSLFLRRIYEENTAVTLTAPASFDGMDFIKWEIEGSGFELSRTLQLTMSSNKKVTAIYGYSDLCGAVDNCTLIFQTGGDGGGWFGQTLEYLRGNDAALSPWLAAGESSYIETTVTGPGYISFYQRAIPGGYLRTSVNGKNYDYSWPHTGWTKRGYYIPTGSHTIRWEYFQSNDSSSLGYGGIDEVKYIQGLNNAASIIDFNHDGQMDILMRNYGDGANQFWIMYRTYKLNTITLPKATNKKWRIAGTGDFNDDGDLDILWRNYDNGQNRVWLMNGTSVSGTVYLPSATNLKWRISGTGDFNNDGKVDILWRNYGNGQNQVWLMNGTMRLSKLYLPTATNKKWRFEGVGDFNGDGKADIVMRNYANGSNRIWLMDGDTKLSSIDLKSATNLNWRICGTADFDGDGYRDILLRNYSSGQNRYWQMKGGGTVYNWSFDLPSATNLSWRFALSGD